MNREELKRVVVLLDIADDYESLEHVERRLISIAKKRELSFTRDDVIGALSELIRSGLATAYRLSTNRPEAIAGIPDRSEFDDFYTYFYITKEGTSEIYRMRAKADWPFDDFCEFRPDFVLDGQ